MNLSPQKENLEPVRQLSGKRCLPQSRITCVESLGHMWWKETADSYKLSSSLPMWAHSLQCKVKKQTPNLFLTFSILSQGLVILATCRKVAGPHSVAPLSSSSRFLLPLPPWRTATTGSSIRGFLSLMSQPNLLFSRLGAMALTTDEETVM